VLNNEVQPFCLVEIVVTKQVYRTLQTVVFMLLSSVCRDPDETETQHGAPAAARQSAPHRRGFPHHVGRPTIPHPAATTLPREHSQ